MQGDSGKKANMAADHGHRPALAATLSEPGTDMPARSETKSIRLNQNL